jgi:hypothetical protein
MITKSNTKNRRKNFNLLFLLPLIVFSHTSCQKEAMGKDPQSKNAATFTSTIHNFIIEFANSRAAGINWHQQDTIGIYAIESKQTLSNESIYNNYDNIKYVTQTAGEEVIFSAMENEIMFPHTDQPLDFIAYYPYTPNISEFILPIDISVQEPQSNLNVMYATKYEHSSANPEVEFKFKHILSPVILHLSSTAGIYLQDATITIENANTNATLNLVDGTIFIEPEKGTLTPIIHYDDINNQLTAKAILLPGQQLNDLYIQIKLTNEESYTYLPAEYILPPQVTRVYTLDIAYEDVELINSGSTIEDWEYDIDETIHVLKPNPKDPDDQTGSDYPDPDSSLRGTKENPYTISEAITNQGRNAWVEGYVLGFVTVVGTERKLETDITLSGADENIILADSISETDTSLMIPIELKSIEYESPHFNELNLINNGSFIGKKVKIYCRLKRYKSGPGGVDVTDFEIGI